MADSTIYDVDQPGSKRYPLPNQFFLSSLWFGFNVQWGALLPIVLPAQVADMAGPRKELYNGLLLAIGAFLAMIVSPVAGALSDRSTSKLGRRRPYIWQGLIANCASLALMGLFGKGSNIFLFLLCFLAVQFTANWWGGPYAGLIPDLVPLEDRGRASAWLMFMTILGTIVGVGSSGQLIALGGYKLAYAFIIGCLLLCFVITLLGVRETPLSQPPKAISLGEFIRSFYLDPREHRDFYWVLITRTMVTMGVFSVYNFFQYFLGDVIGIANPAQQGSALLGIGALVSLPFGFLAGRLSDRWGRKRTVMLSGGIMAVTSIIFVFTAFSGSWPLAIALAITFGIGSCAYQTVDWALAIDVLPKLDNAGKDMGIWHVALVLPAVIAPAISGFVLQQLKPVSLVLGYTVVFLIAAFWFSLGTILVKNIRGVR
ncbi:MAG TPA: MFS transporter [Pyrinomonadaceae bacterium]|nr:MFS transporter [Pyrinomonadaceae bacterium]